MAGRAAQAKDLAPATAVTTALAPSAALTAAAASAQAAAVTTTVAATAATAPVGGTPAAVSPTATAVTTVDHPPGAPDSEWVSEPFLWRLLAVPDDEAFLLHEALAADDQEPSADDLSEGCPGTTAPSRPAGPEMFKAGFWDRTSGDGAGFASGGASDRMAPGAVLAWLAEDAWGAGLDRLADDELIGFLRAARRLASWAAALELSAAGDLLRRRRAEEAAGEAGVAEHASDELAAALTLTGRAAGRLEDQALALGRLPATMRALGGGRIDLPRAAVIADEVSGLSDAHAAIVEQVIIHDAPGQTTGQLRAAVRRAVIAADPAAARVRKEHAQREARVERWDEPAGTAGLAGRDLPAPDVLAADCNITAIARELRAAGLDGSMDNLRAQVFLALLAGRSPYSLLPSPPDTDAGSSSACPEPTRRGGGHAQGSHEPGSGAAGRHGCAARGAVTPGAGVTGVVNLTMPVSAWLGLSDVPGDVAGYGPLDAADSAALLARIAASRDSRWCLTLTDAKGHAVAHGCAHTGPISGSGWGPGAGSGPGPRADPGPGAGWGPGSGVAAAIAWLAGVKVEALEAGECSHRRESPAYRPPPSLQHLVRVRQRTCSFPGCRRPADRCDQDHTLAYDQGGRTCLCNLAPLCRRHHRAKQTHGWHLDQPQPGILVWTLPGGRSYTVRPTIYLSE